MALDSKSLGRLRAELRALTDLMCWYAPSFRGDLELGFGEAFDKSPGAANPLLVCLWEARQINGGPRLVIECPWRAEFEGTVVRCSTDQEELLAPRRREKHTIQGSVVSACALHEPGLDLELVFDNGLVLYVVWADATVPERDDHYALVLRDEALRVGPRGHVSLSPLEPPPPRDGPGGELVQFPLPRR